MLRKQALKDKINLIIIIVCITIVGITMLFKQRSFASWKEGEAGIQYEDENGELVKGFYNLDENLYFFDENGYLVTGKFFCEDNQKYYYADESGVIQTGIIKLKDKFYIADEAGVIQTGFVEYENQRYFFDGAANMVQGWFKSEENWYYANDEGVIMTGFISNEGYRYYLNPDGTRVSDTIMEIDGLTYVFNKDGSVDENATTMYPVYQYLLDKHLSFEGNETIDMNLKVQACAVLRASNLQNGYISSQEENSALQNLLKNRGVKCAGGYEFSYGGVADYGIERLIADMEKDYNLQQILLYPSISEVGLGLHSVDNVFYYDIIFICNE